ncbi:hypothetical protein M0811_08151 [Anaeramoeba ignava]|uniref:Uncharacterized protein n=1 Tax=Anaeramoeba ignava TaxID=1746090 RepID=A0A9Q0LJD7_ANAIG|nr:hypothetical protein M0811_08151 [Anaeramoeba ignava]
MSVYKTPRSLIRSLSNILTPSNNNINNQNQNIQNIQNIQNNKLNSLNKRNNNKNFSTNFTPSPIQTPKALIQKIIQAKAIKTSKHPLNPNFRQISNKKIEIKNENENENENENNLIQNVENIDFNLNTSDFSSDGEDNFNLESDSNDIQELEIINSPKKQYQLSFTNQENLKKYKQKEKLKKI